MNRSALQGDSRLCRTSVPAQAVGASIAIAAMRGGILVHWVNAYR